MLFYRTKEYFKTKRIDCQNFVFQKYLIAPNSNAASYKDKLLKVCISEVI